jgi:hypothetical protein
MRKRTFRNRLIIKAKGKREKAKVRKPCEAGSLFSFLLLDVRDEQTNLFAIIREFNHSFKIKS